MILYILWVILQVVVYMYNVGGPFTECFVLATNTMMMCSAHQFPIPTLPLGRTKYPSVNSLVFQDDYPNLMSKILMGILRIVNKSARLSCVLT